MLEHADGVVNVVGVIKQDIIEGAVEVELQQLLRFLLENIFFEFKVMST